MSEKLDDKFIGPEVEVLISSKTSKKGKNHRIYRKGNIYLGSTDGKIEDDEEPVVFDRQLPFTGFYREHIRYLKS
ncbi:hypothetical protein HZA33_04945 [Candidatus Pacearchaeota archaeon]|nr:hypothetical protein [Candidatus Pacearchaeota archaeon]